MYRKIFYFCPWCYYESDSFYEVCIYQSKKMFFSGNCVALEDYYNWYKRFIRAERVAFLLSVFTFVFLYFILDYSFPDKL